MSIVRPAVAQFRPLRVVVSMSAELFTACEARCRTGSVRETRCAYVATLRGVIPSADTRIPQVGSARGVMTSGGVQELLFSNEQAMTEVTRKGVQVVQVRREES